MSDVHDEGDTIRIQFECPRELWERALPYVKAEKNRATFGLLAFEEWVNRREGRDERVKRERIRQDKQFLRTVISEMKERGEI